MLKKKKKSLLASTSWHKCTKPRAGEIWLL